MSKAHIHKAFRNNDGSGTDFNIKVAVQDVLRKYQVHTKIPNQNEKYFGVRPDLISEQSKIVVEIHGSKFGNVHEKDRVLLQDDYKFGVYKANDVSVLIVDFDLWQFLGCTLEQYIAPILMNLKKTDKRNVSF